MKSSGTPRVAIQDYIPQWANLKRVAEGGLAEGRRRIKIARMNKTELPCEFEGRDGGANDSPSAAEMKLLDRELEEYELNPAVGSTWDDFEARLRQEFV